MRARKVGRSTENRRVGYSYTGDTTYSLKSDKTGKVIGRVEKTSTGFRAWVGNESGTFRTMEDVRAWASNLIIDDPSIEE